MLLKHVSVRDDFWNELYKCDDYFISFHYDHCAFDEDGWKELVEKWGLNIKIIPRRFEMMKI